MHELSGRQVLGLFRGRLPSQDRVAMRLSTEPRDHFADAAHLRSGVLHKHADVGGRLLRGFFSGFTAVSS